MIDDTLRHFTLTHDHLLLLRHAHVRWQNAETGAPAIDPKRPYGNSEVARDVAEILDWEIPDQDEDPNAYLAMKRKALELHRQTEVALAIVLRCGSVPGEYIYPHYGEWQRLSGGW